MIQFDGRIIFEWVGSMNLSERLTEESIRSGGGKGGKRLCLSQTQPGFHLDSHSLGLCKISVRGT